jgi:hypothetical protein
VLVVVGLEPGVTGFLDELHANVAVNIAAKGYVPYGPMICLCEVPDADPSRDFGMCHNEGCGRKPLALMLATQRPKTEAA